MIGLIWLERRDFRIASLSGLLPSAENTSPSARIFGTSGTDPVCPHPHQNKKQTHPEGWICFLVGAAGFGPTRCRSQSPVPYRLATPQYVIIVKTPTVQNYGRMSFIWGGGWDSNPRSSEPQSDALGQLRYIHHVRQFKKLPGAPWGTRTPGPLLRRQMLYPAELTAHVWSGWGESNPPIQLGRLAFYQWITSA